MGKKSTLLTHMIAGCLVVLMQPAFADELDSIVSSGTLKCGVVLDFPPIGFRDPKNNPVGFDVDYCKDLAAALGVKAEIVETPWPDRIPALVSHRTDVSIASASDTLERAQTVGFSIPYNAFVYQVAVRKGSAIKTFEDLRGKAVGTVVSTTNESFFLDAFNKWNDPAGKHLSLQTEADMFLALEQGRVDAIIDGSTSIASFIDGGKFPNTERGPVAPFPVDMVGIMTTRQEYGFLRFLDLFVNRQVRSGRYAELYAKWVGGQPPNLSSQGR